MKIILRLPPSTLKTLTTAHVSQEGDEDVKGPKKRLRETQIEQEPRKRIKPERDPTEDDQTTRKMMSELVSRVNTLERQMDEIKRCAKQDCDSNGTEMHLATRTTGPSMGGDVTPTSRGGPGPLAEAQTQVTDEVDELLQARIKDYEDRTGRRYVPPSYVANRGEVFLRLFDEALKRLTSN